MSRSDVSKPFGLAAAAAALMGGTNTDASKKASAIAPARDGDIAIHQELRAARGKGTVAAYDLFIARHSRHPLAELARRERRQLLRTEDR